MASSVQYANWTAAEIAQDQILLAANVPANATNASAEALRAWRNAVGQRLFQAQAAAYAGNTLTTDGINNPGS